MNLVPTSQKGAMTLLITLANPPDILAYVENHQLFKNFSSPL